MDPVALMALARHGDVVATARAFLDRAGALRVVVLLDAGDGETLMVDADPEATQITEGDTVATIPAASALPTPPRPLPDVRAVPHTAISLDPETGELEAPLGTIDHLAGAVRALAAAFGGMTVATAEFATRDPELPLAFAARQGEPVILAAGDAQFELG